MARRMQKEINKLVKHFEKLGYNIVSSHELGNNIKVIWMKKLVKKTVRKINEEGYYVKETKEVPQYVVLHQLANGSINVYRPRLLR